MTITMQTEGRRIYLLGNTFSVKDQIKSGGGKWDPDRKAWYLGVQRRELAEKLANQLRETASAQQSTNLPYDGEVCGKAQYKEHVYYVRWHGTTSRGTEAFRLVTLDGKIDFWADANQCQWVKRYEQRSVRGEAPRFPTLAGIARFIARQKRETEKTGIDCWACRKYCTCGTDRFCTHHHDGCDVCGEER